jgi:hypothetical protein
VYWYGRALVVWMVTSTLLRAGEAPADVTNATAGMDRPSRRARKMEDAPSFGVLSWNCLFARYFIFLGMGVVLT